MLKYDNYFMDLENYTLTKVGFTIGDQAMAMQKHRGTIPEWMNAIEQNLDYYDEKNKEMAIAVCKAWVLRGHGDEWFVGDGH